MILNLLYDSGSYTKWHTPHKLTALIWFLPAGDPHSAQVQQTWVQAQEPLGWKMVLTGVLWVALLVYSFSDEEKMRRKKTSKYLSY